MTKKVNLLIIQERIPHYRIPFYDLLGRVNWLEVTVLHSGAPTHSRMNAYSETILEARSAWGFHIQKSLIEEVDDYDVVIGMFNPRWLTTLAVLLRRQRPKFIWWGIGFGRSRLARLLRLWLVVRSDGLIVYSEGAREEFLNKGISPEKVFVAPNTVKVDLSVDSAAVKVKRKNFLFVGSLHARKRLPDLLHAFAAVRDLIPQCTAVEIIGDGPEEQRLHELVQDLGISDQVRFLGRITREEELRSYFDRTLAAISPGQAGLSVLHAFAHGVPFVTSRNAISGGEIDNIVDGVNGYLYDGSVTRLGKLMVRLANNVGVSERLGKNAQLHYGSRRTMDRMVAVFERAIRHAIEK